MSPNPPLLAADLLARLEAAQLATRRRLVGSLAGEHRSKRYGSSLDFADQREYHPGDDFRRIDYHVLARLDQVLVRLYEADEDLQVRVLIDTSASMGFGDKLQQARRLAAAIGFVALTRRDVVSVHTFPLDRPGPRFVGRGAVGRLFSVLEGLEPDGVTAFAASVGHFLAKPGPPGITVVVSDLLTNEWKAALARLPSRGADVVVVHVLSPEDLDPRVRDDLLGDLELVDGETGETVLVSASESVLALYARGAAAWADEVASQCRRSGAAYVRVRSDDDVKDVLFGAWRAAGVLR